MPTPGYLTPPSLLSLCLSQRLCTLLHDPECLTAGCHSEVTAGKAPDLLLPLGSSFPPPALI